MKYKNKTYWRIPGGEVQWGHLSHTVTIWFRGRCWSSKRLSQKNIRAREKAL